MNLNPLRGGFFAHLAGEELGHPRFQIAALAAVLLGGGLEGQQPGRLDRRRHVGQLELDGLEVGDGLPELFPLLGVSNRVLERGARHADAARGDVDAPDLERRQHVPETVPFLPDQAVPRNLAILQNDLTGTQALVAQLPDAPPDPKTGAALVQQEGADAPVLRLPRRVGLGQQHEGVAAFGIGDEHFAAVNDVHVTLPYGGRLHGGGVGAGIRLGQHQPAAPLPGGERRHVGLLLGFGAVPAGHQGHHEVGIEDARQAHPAARQLLANDGVAHVIEPAAAVFGRQDAAEQAHLGHLPDHGVRVGVGVLVFAGNRDDLVVHEAPHRRLQLPLGIVQREIHASPSVILCKLTVRPTSQ